MIEGSTERRSTASPLRRRAASVLTAGLMSLLIAIPASASSEAAMRGGNATPATVSASSTATVMAAELLSWLNRDRVAAGLRPLLAWTAMGTVANQRSARMAATQTLSHQAAGGDPGTALTSAGIGWYGFGEIIGESSYPWGGQAAYNLYSMWRSSPVHHAIMFSASYNYIGVGIARAGSGTTWSSILFTESADHTPPTANNGSLTSSGTTLRFSWSGIDRPLQTHTAGLRGFDVQFSVDGGSWYLLRHSTTATSLIVTGRARQHSYSFRVRSSDRRGNLSGWTAAKRIWLP